MGKLLAELVEELPPHAQKEVRDFVEFLVAKHGHQSEDKLRQDWAGALHDYRDHYSALELEQKALEWRSE